MRSEKSLRPFGPLWQLPSANFVPAFLHTRFSPPKLSPSYNSTAQSPVRDTVRVNANVRGTVRVRARVCGRLRLRLRVAQSVARTFDLHAGETVDADAFALEDVGAIVSDAQRGPAVFGRPAVLVEGHFAR